MKLKSVFKGVTAVSASLLAIVISGSTLLFNNEGIVNNALHIKTTRIETSEEDENVDTEYYKNEFGTTNTDSLAATLEMEQAVQADNLRQAEEGNVLLTNKNNALPLGNNAKVTLFGNGGRKFSLLQVAGKHVYGRNRKTDFPHGDEECFRGLKRKYRIDGRSV